jgi:hypothetical protein
LGRGQIKLLRQTSPTTAKVTIRLGASDEMVAVFLRYHHGSWTSTRYQATWGTNAQAERAVHKLMLAIDELGEK